MPTQVALSLFASLIFQLSFGQVQSFKVIENRKVKNPVSTVWAYGADNVSKSTYLNFDVFLGGASSDLFTASNYKDVAFIYIGCNFQSAALNKSDRSIHVPLYLLDVEDEQNLKIKDIDEGHSVLKKLFFRADQRPNAYFKIEFRTVTSKDRDAFLSLLAKSENAMSKSSGFAL